MKKKIHQGFTLVELIIVIIILAVLATIWFISLSWYVANSRDSKRLVEIKNIKKAIDIYQIQTGEIPKSWNNISNVFAKWAEIFTNSEIDETFQNLLKIHGLKTDSITWKNYIYGVSSDWKKYQVGTFVEKEKNLSFASKTYADTQEYVSVVEGNYDGIMKFSTGGNIFLANPPSLLVNNTGSVEIFWWDEVYFLVDGGKNIYYNIQNIEGVNNILEKQYGIGAVFTGVIINSVTESNIASEFTSNNGLLQSFWWDLEKIGNEIFWAPTNIVYSSCSYSWVTFSHWTNQVFYKVQEAYSCLDKGVIYSCVNGEIFDDENNEITSPTEFIYENCVDNTSCKFWNGNLFNGTCHF